MHIDLTGRPSSVPRGLRRTTFTQNRNERSLMGVDVRPQTQCSLYPGSPAGHVPAFAAAAFPALRSASSGTFNRGEALAQVWSAVSTPIGRTLRMFGSTQMKRTPRLWKRAWTWTGSPSRPPGPLRHAARRQRRQTLPSKVRRGNAMSHMYVAESALRCV